jgi:cysteine-rich secretory family protein
VPTFPRLFAALLLLTACGPELTSQDQAFLDAHNQARAAAQPAPSPALPPLHWSEDVASTAQAWASECTFGRDTRLGDLGQSIASFSPVGSGTPEAVVQGWADEGRNYDYASDTCNGACGDYTQLVWRATTAVGCARAVCNAASSPYGGAENWELWVCDYDPGGNIIGLKPY